MGCTAWSRPSAPVPVNPRIQIRPRYQLALLSQDEKIKERDRLMVRIGQKRIYFSDWSSALTAHSEEVLKNVAEVLLEYPELDLTVEAHPGSSRPSNKRLSEKEQALLKVRAEVCSGRLRDLGVLSDVHTEWVEPDHTGNELHGNNASKYSAAYHTLQSPRAQSQLARDLREPHGCVRFRAGEAKLLEPQERLDYMLARTGFDFLPKAADLSDKGLRAADVVARALKETSHRVIIAVPKKSSELAKQRAEAIADGIRFHGVTSEISVETAKGSQKYATVRIEEGEADELGPQGQLVEILKETPLAFRMNSAELAPEVLPVIKRCADVLKQVKDMSVLVEAYSGNRGVGLNEARIREAMLRRAERVVAWLQAEGVEIPLLAKGYAVPCSEGGTPTNARGSARVVLTLIGPGEEDLEPIDPEDNEAGCMGSRSNILGCL